MKGRAPGDPVEQPAEQDREREAPEQCRIMRPLANPADRDDGDSDCGHKLGAQNRGEPKHRGANEQSSLGRNAATGIDQTKTRYERCGGEALRERMGVEIDQLEPDGVHEARYDRAGEARDVASPDEAADHRRQRYDADQDGDAAEPGRWRRSEHLSDRHETGHQSRPQPAPFAGLKVPWHQPLMIDEAVRLVEPHDLVGMEYAREQRHDAGAYRHRQKADRQQRQPIARQEPALRRLGQSPSGGGKGHRTPPGRMDSRTYRVGSRRRKRNRRLGDPLIHGSTLPDQVTRSSSCEATLKSNLRKLGADDTKNQPNRTGSASRLVLKMVSGRQTGIPSDFA